VYRLLDAIDSENIKAIYKTSLQYYGAVMPVADPMSRSTAADAAFSALKGFMLECGMEDEQPGSEVSKEDEEAYYEIHGRPGEAKYETMMSDAHAAFDRLMAGSEAA